MPEVAEAIGKLITFFGEHPDTVLVAEQVAKAITSGEPLPLPGVPEHLASVEALVRLKVRAAIGKG